MSIQPIGYLITGLWTLVNIAAFAAIVVFIIFLYKYLHKSNKTQKEADTSPDGITPDGTTPDGTTPDGTTPDGTTPDGTTPDGTTPDGTTPDGTTPDGTTPDGTTPKL